mgnify:CR=1 FL=1
MIKAFIFDLDGVVVDTVGYHFDSWIKLAHSLGFKINDDIKEKLKGINRMTSLDIVLAHGSITASQAEKIEYAKQKNDWYLDSIASMNDDIILDGVKEFLISTQKEKLKIAVGSASGNARKVLSKTSIYSKFDTIKDSNDAKHSKPHPEVFLKAAEALSVDPSEAIIFEDSAKGVEAAKAGGFKCVGIGSADILTDADIVMDDLTHITADIIVKLLS